MNKQTFFDFVLCKHDGCDKPFLFRAPKFSNLEYGDRVIVETKNGEAIASVIACESFADSETKTIDLIMKASQANDHVCKVLARIVPYEYREEESENE